VQTGIWHDFANGVSLMADLVWVEFSRFVGSYVSIGDRTAVVNADYKDIWPLPSVSSGR